MKTLQETLKDKLEILGIPYKTINVYGERIVITTLSRETANKWIDAISPRIAQFKDVIESLDYAKENKQTSGNPSVIKVWRAYFVI
jgi:hypothetical protein